MSEPPIVVWCEKLKAAGGSDLHLSVGQPPHFRIHGHLHQLRNEALTLQEFEALLKDITPVNVWQDYIKTGDADFPYEIPGVSRFRVNLLNQHRGRGAVLRRIPSDVLSIAELGLPKQLIHFAQADRGMVLVTGPTSSGKSTTLAALIHEINCTRAVHILTIEDPIEFVHENRLALVTQRQVGAHTNSFSAALRAAVREDPNVILVGEMRDLETIGLALTCAEMGLLVLGTLHTSSAPKTVDRIIDAFPHEEQDQIRTMLSESLAGVISQQLLRRADGKGRIAAMEILIGSTALGNLIREGKTFQIGSHMQTGRGEGMVTMDRALLDLVERKIVDPREAVELASDRNVFARYVNPSSSEVPSSLLGSKP